MSDSFFILIKGRIPSKKNSQMAINNRVVESNRHKKWRRNNAHQVLHYKGLKLKNFDIQLEFWMPDNRRTDLDNKVTTILDYLKKMDVILDDSWQNIRSTYYRPRGVDKKNPRVEIWLKH
jgi:Holliday junction resolvase RusA-like endonuclease